jgi:perosamine synthetase
MVTTRSIPLARPYLDGREEELVLDVLRSDSLACGTVAPAFERGFADRVGTRFAVACSSGTSGLHAALHRLGLGPGDEVITSSFSFVASANVILFERATPVFAEIDELTFNVDPAAIEAAITDRTRAIIPVHIFGYPCDIEAITAIAERHGLAVIEDACEAIGCTIDGRGVGTHGNLAVWGFYPNKQLTTGEGGVVTTSSAAIKERLDSERNQGRAPDMGWLDHDRLGFNYRLSDIACALGLAQLERLDDMLAGRARVAELYREALAGVDGLELPCPDAGGNRRGWFVFVVQLPRDHDRDDVVRALAERSIPSKPYFPAIHLMSFYREQFGHREGQFPVCEDVAARSIALPFFPAMTEGQVDRVATELRSVLGR